MIEKIVGTLVYIDENILLKTGNLTFSVMIPEYAKHKLKTLLNKEVELYVLIYLEQRAQGASYHPNMIGFLTKEEKEFFELFTKVQRIGPKTALKALIYPPAKIASAIERKDVKFLKSLPEIGSRTAEGIVAELSGKCKKYLAQEEESISIENAVEALKKLGLKEYEARQKITQIIKENPDIKVEELIKLALK